MVGVQQKGVTERKRRDGRHEGESEEVGVGNEDDSSFVGDGVLSRDGGKGTPLVQVKQHISVGDQSVSLAVSSGADEEPSEHGMATVPLFSLNGRSPSPLGQGGEVRLPFLLGVLVNFRVHDIQRA